MIKQGEFMLQIFILIISLLIGFNSIAKTQPKLLFKTNFQSDVVIGPHRDLYASKMGGWQDIIGKDNSTGFSFGKVNNLGAYFTGIQNITTEPVTLETIKDHVQHEIKSVVGPNGSQIKSLTLTLKKKGPVGAVLPGAGHAQAPLLFARDYRLADMKTAYVSYWFRFDEGMPARLHPEISSGNWRVLFEFKTGGYKNTGNGDFRIQTTVLKNKENKLYWMTKADTNANAQTSEIPLKDYWVYRNYDMPVPIGKWFKFEAYWMRYADGTKGRYWNAIDGKVLFDIKNKTLGEFSLPVGRLFVINSYSGGEPPVISEIAGLEIWDNFPCGQFRSCYQK